MWSKTRYVYAEHCRYIGTCIEKYVIFICVCEDIISYLGYSSKSISLPIGKVSIRQTAILFSGILVTFLVFMTMDNLVISGLVFAVFLGIGLIGTRVMTADQMIKSHLMMLVRGTSLEQKPEYMENPKKKQQQTGNEKPNPNQNEQQKNNNGLINQVLSQIESLYKKKDNVTANAKKESKSIDDKVENNNKKFSASIELTDQNIIHVTSKSNDDSAKPLPSTEKKKNNYSVDSLISKLSKKEKPKPDSIKDHITISLDGKPIYEPNGMVIKSKESFSLVLENNQRYTIIITADDEFPETLQD